jgi:hypothetical protein
MNDHTNLYVALKVSNASVGSSFFRVEFDNDHDGTGRVEIGDEVLDLTDDGFRDLFYRQLPSGGFNWARDEDYGGSRDGVGLDADHAGFSFYELSHPLDTADNSHDFSLRPGMRVGFEVNFAHCPLSAQCAYTTAARLGDVVVVSGSRVAPETQISGGPAEGSVVAESSTSFVFAATDDAIEPVLLTFECKLDDGTWSACSSPQSRDPGEGRHVFQVRATDEMLNTDQTPAVRTWAVDTTGPSKPVIRGRRSVRQGQRIVLRFSATDRLAKGVRFKCAAGSARLKRCSAVYRVKLRPGRHVVRVRAFDRLGNESDLSTARIRVKRR